MPTFVYKAVDQSGKEVSAQLDAPSRISVLEQIEAQKLLPIKVEETVAKDAVHEKRHANRRVSKVQVEAFTRELSNLLAAGVPLSKSLTILSREAANPAARAQWTAIHEYVSEGMTLADALARFPQSFPPVYIAMVRAGETGGFLDLVLNQIAQFRTRESDLKGKVRAAMVYPVVLATLAAGIVVFLLMFFIPRFSSIFADFGGDLPGLTKAIVSVSEFILHYWLIVVAAIVLGIVGYQRTKNTEDGRLFMERVFLKSPVVGVGIARFALVRFCRMLGTLVESGVPLISSLTVAKEAIGNQTLASTVDHSIKQVQKGKSLAKSLAECPDLFPASVVEMIAVAEETGRLDEELVRLAAAYEDELDRHLRMSVALIEPAMLFLMAAIVGTVVIGMLLPIFNLQELMR